MTVVLILLAVALIAALAYWELGIAEGVHVGPRVVILLYDLVSHRYDHIKQFDPTYEDLFLSDPLVSKLREVRAPLVLDVATGTGRLPRSLLAQANFDGRVIAVDGSRRMLAEAARSAQSTSGVAERLTLIWQDARHLPFDDDTFDAVTCLESLEFMPHTHQAVHELVRVLRPGGVALLTNRVGPWRKFLPGHTQSPPAFESLLGSLGLEQIQTQTWQVEYDLVWAVKLGHGTSGDTRPLLDILHCPRCNGKLSSGEKSLACAACRRAYPIAGDGVIEMMQ
jgi:ubiquinone/menaquinone biosynthesis C-methylase UbiE